MKRLLSIALFAAMLTSLGVIANAQDENKSSEENKTPDNLTIPEGKLAKLSLQTRLSSKLSEVNDEVTAVLYEPVRGEDGRVVIDRGTEFIGRVTQVQAAKRPQKEATMTVVSTRCGCRTEPKRFQSPSSPLTITPTTPS